MTTSQTSSGQQRRTHAHFQRLESALPPPRPAPPLPRAATPPSRARSLPRSVLSAPVPPFAHLRILAMAPRNSSSASRRLIHSPASAPEITAAGNRQVRRPLVQRDLSFIAGLRRARRRLPCLAPRPTLATSSFAAPWRPEPSTSSGLLLCSVPQPNSGLRGARSRAPSSHPCCRHVHAAAPH